MNNTILVRIRNRTVTGDEAYNKTKIRVPEEITEKVSDDIINIDISEKIDTWVNEFEDTFRHDFYVKTRRYVGEQL